MTVHPWEEKRPSRAKVIGVYSKRLLLRNFNSRPYLSGDLFQDNADYVHNPTKFRYNRSWFRDLKDAQVIFCPSADLQNFLLEFVSFFLLKFDITKQQQKFNKKVLISRYFIGADPFLGPEKGTNVAAHIQFVVVAFI